MKIHKRLIDLESPAEVVKQCVASFRPSSFSLLTLSYSFCRIVRFAHQTRFDVRQTDRSFSSADFDVDRARSGGRGYHRGRLIQSTLIIVAIHPGFASSSHSSAPLLCEYQSACSSCVTRESAQITETRVVPFVLEIPYHECAKAGNDTAECGVMMNCNARH